MNFKQIRDNIYFNMDNVDFIFVDRGDRRVVEHVIGNEYIPSIKEDEETYYLKVKLIGESKRVICLNKGSESECKSMMNKLLGLQTDLCSF